MKANPDKCRLLKSSTSQSELKIGNVTIKSSTCEKLLGIKIDNKLRLNAHSEDLCKKSSRKIHALARVTSYMAVSKRPILMNDFFRSQFKYCLLLWMRHSRTLNNKINRLHERCLRIVYNNKLSSFQNLLDQDRSVSVQIRNLQTLAIEMYEVSKGIAPKISSDIFSSNFRANYDLNYQSEFSRPLVKSVFNGTESISDLGRSIWDLVPLQMKQK